MFLIKIKKKEKISNLRGISFICAVVGQEYSYIDENYGITWMYFPDGNGIPNVVNLTQLPPLDDDPKEDSNENRIWIGRGRGSGRGSDRTTSIRKSIHFELYTRYTVHMVLLSVKKSTKGKT